MIQDDPTIHPFVVRNNFGQSITLSKNRNLEYDRAKAYLDTITTARTEEDEFVAAQMIFLDYIRDIDGYKLSTQDSADLRFIGEGQNPYAGYARSIFYLLTGDKIPIALTHLDGSVSHRSTKGITDESRVSSLRFNIYPNPTYDSEVGGVIDRFDYDCIYELRILDAYGQVIGSYVARTREFQFAIGNTPGVYFICLFVDGELTEVKRVVHI